MKQLRLCPTFLLAAIIVPPAFAIAQDAPPAAPAADAPAAAPAAPAADASIAPAEVAADAKPAHFAEQRQTTISEVTAIDPATRIISLKEEGEDAPRTYELGKDIRNVDQLRVGDRVKVDVYESVTVRVVPPGEEIKEDGEVATLARSQPGEKPGGLAASTRTRTATISSIFPSSKEFLTRNAAGKLTTWKVNDPAKLEQLKSGDRVQLSFTRAMAVKVSPAPPKPATTTAPTAAGAGTAAATTPPDAKAAPAPTAAPAPAPTPP